MKYAVLTTRHCSGFLLWDSATTDFDVASSGNTTEFAGSSSKNAAAKGWSRRSITASGAANGIPVPTLGQSSWPSSTNWQRSTARFRTSGSTWTIGHRPNLSVREIYDELKTLRPNAVVEFNQHVQDGTKVRYFPTDVLDGELTPPPATGHNPFPNG